MLPGAQGAQGVQGVQGVQGATRLGVILASLSLLGVVILKSRLMASTRWFNLFFPAKPPPERHRVDNASLPPELLLEIFNNVARSTRSPDRDTVVYPTLDELERSSRHPLAGALLTCSCWTGPATVALYQEIGVFPVLSHTHTRTYIYTHIRTHTY